MNQKTTKTTRSTPANHNSNAGNDTNQQIRNPKELRQAIAEGCYEFRLLLMGGACFSRKHITTDDRGRFHIFNYIDDSEQELTARELYTQSNIGEAMQKGAFVREGQGHE
jgi:hypothetical protein